MKIFTILSLLCSTMLMTLFATAQETWPKTANTSNGSVVKLYQLQPESFSDNTLKAHAAISVLESGKSDPVFGMAWITANTTTNGDQVQIQSLHISNIKLPGESDDDKLDALKTLLENESANWNITMPMSDLQSNLNLNTQQKQLSQQINTNPPKVIYSSTPSILVTIDGDPKLQHNNDWNMDVVVNTPFTIVKNADGNFYLYGGKHWYAAPSVTGPYNMTTTFPQDLGKVEQAINDAAAKNDNNDEETGKETDDNTIYKVIVTEQPTELIQSKGEANFAPVQGTNLLYISNSDNDIFMDINGQQYYVLISGRWYHSKTLSGNWQYVPADKLPGDFALIPEGSPKDHVLASVAGTDEAKDAKLNAEVPQTAKVDRKSSHADITYDGEPQFAPIDEVPGLSYAINTPNSVLLWRGRYFTVDNGVWYDSPNPMGPWAVSVERPSVVALIPPRYPVYNMKYVYIYDYDDDWAYTGYTPGYLNAYVYGPTVVFGTGWYYRPWYGHYYYARPWTWGFGFAYNPWYGWGFGFDYSYSWFNIGFGFYRPWGAWYGGWWGPHLYRPFYAWSPYRVGGYYRGGFYRGGFYGGYYGFHPYGRGGYHGTVVVNNIYRNRTGIVTRNNQRSFSNNNRGYTGRQNYSGNNGYNNNRYRSGNSFSQGNGNRNYRQPNSSFTPQRNTMPGRQGYSNYQRGSISSGTGNRDFRNYTPQTRQPSYRGQITQPRSQSFERPSYSAPRSSGGSGGSYRSSGGGGSYHSSGGGGGRSSSSGGGSHGGGRRG